MIEINLVPQQSGKRWKPRSPEGQGVFLPKETLIGLGGGFLVLLLLGHGFLQWGVADRIAKYKEYERQWEEISSAKANVDQIIGEAKYLRGKVKSLEDVLGGETISWPRKLNEISDHLPRGVWLSRITLSADNALLIKGSAVSKDRTEMINVHNFTSNLKNFKSFADRFSNIELELIKSRKIAATQIADFTIRADLKE